MSAARRGRELNIFVGAKIPTKRRSTSALEKKRLIDLHIKPQQQQLNSCISSSLWGFGQVALRGNTLAAYPSIYLILSYLSYLSLQRA